MPAAGPPLLIVGFENGAESQPRDAWLPAALEEFLTWRLRRVPALCVIPTVRAHQAWRDLAPAAETQADWPRVGRMLGARHWLSATCSGHADQLSLELRLAPLNDAAQPKAVQVGPARFNEALDAATQWVLAESGVPALESRLHALVFSTPSDSAGAVEYFARAVLAIRQERTRDALRYAQQAVELDAMMRPAQLVLAQLELHVSDRGQANAAARLRALREIARRADDRLDLAQIELTEGLLLAGTSAYDAALIRMETALKWSRECGERYTQLAAMTNLCDVYLSRRPGSADLGEEALRAFSTENLKAAALWQERVLELLRSLGDVVTEAPTCNKLALIYERLAQPEKALEMHRRTLAAAQACGSARTEATGWMFLGQFFRSQQRLPEALDAITRCHELAEESARPGVLVALADVYRELKQPKEALARYEEASQRFSASEDLFQQLVCLRRIAQLREELGDRKAAVRSLREALDIAHALKLPEGEVIQKQLADWGEKTP
ncbi:MAG: tetratricopeptide repeat protein [Phycisphaerae bacterium]